MDNIDEQLKNTKDHNNIYQPVIFDLKQEDHVNQVKQLLANNKIQNVSDDYVEQLKELFQINNPTKVFSPDFESQFSGYLTTQSSVTSLWQQGNWIYYPWSASLVHVLTDAEYQRVRTSRNRNLITESEQIRFYNSTIGVAGMSVGNSVVSAIIIQGGSKHIKLADFDLLALSNINRIRSSISNLGLPKVIMTARQIYELNPYAEVEIFSDGITEENIDNFFMGQSRLDVVVEEIDNLAIKHLIRQYASKYQVPLVMAADNGDNGVIDIERYDLDKDTPYFHGRLDNISYEELKGLDKMSIGRLIAKHIGPENVTDHMLLSFAEIGKTLVSWPQLAGAALLNGSALAYCIRKILNGQPIENNRAIISLDEKLTPDYNSPETKAKREAISEDFKKAFNL